MASSVGEAAHRHARKISEFDSAHRGKAPPNGCRQVSLAGPLLGQSRSQDFASLLLNGPAIPGGADPEPRRRGLIQPAGGDARHIHNDSKWDRPPGP